jgi:hypothetical protein
VWEPVIWSDVSPPTSGVLGILSDSRVAQYWDPKRTLSAEIVRSLRADPRAYPQGPRVEEDTIVWDVVALFAENARWDAAFPAPVFHGCPVVQALAGEDPLAALRRLSSSSRGAQDPPGSRGIVLTQLDHRGPD